MILPKNALLAATAGLALSFGAQAQPPRIPMTEIAKLAATENTRRLQDLEKELNENRPRGTPRILFLDPDIISSAAGIRGESQMRAAVQDFVEMRAGREASGKADFFRMTLLARSRSPASLPTLDALSLQSPETEEQQVCGIVPYHPDVALGSYLKRILLSASVGKESYAGKEIALRMSPADFAHYAAMHEVWHCFDNRYRALNSALNGPFDRAGQKHKSEMFADVAAVLDTVLKTGKTDLITGDLEAMRVLSSHTHKPFLRDGVDDEKFMASVSYFIHPGLAELKRTLAEKSLDDLRAMTLEERREFIYGIVEKSALDALRLRAVAAYYSYGTTVVSFVRDMAGEKEGPVAEQFLKNEIDLFLRTEKNYLRDAKPEEPGAEETACLDESKDILAKAGSMPGGTGKAENILNAQREARELLRAELQAATEPSRVRQIQAGLRGAEEAFRSMPCTPQKSRPRSSGFISVQY